MSRDIQFLSHFYGLQTNNYPQLIVDLESLVVGGIPSWAGIANAV